MLLRHRCPTPHAAPLPHLHWPPALQLSVRVRSHAAQVFPGGAQVAVPSDAQFPPVVQQPGQDVASQTHAPPTHRFPAAQGPPVVPQTQLPVAEQVSELAGHAAQLAPAAPHAELLRAVQTLPAQQPVGQLVALHTHAVPLQTWPTPHAGPVPQTHEPVASHPVAFVASHTEHADPALPQAASALGWHACTTSQHPLEQLPALQAPPVHTPPMQVCAAPHAGPVPQRQLPVAEQLLPLPVQSAHDAPCGPQVVSERVVHTLPTQQPVGHEVASHTHAPPTHRWLATQAAFVPQLHPPPIAAQPSDRLGVQVAHAAPAAAQVDMVSAVQVFPAQQPVGQEVASQVQPLPLQLCPVPHAGSLPQRHAPLAEQAFAFARSQVVQAAPPAPQAPALVGALQPPSLPQQPEPQDVESQTQLPPAHRWPAPQAGPEPHWHAPALEQRSAFAVSQGTQACPAPAQDERDLAVQAAPEQHPLRQEFASHSQVPSMQTWPSAQAGTQAIPPPPPAPPPVLPPPPPRAPPSSAGQASRQNPSQQTSVPTQSRVCAHEVSPSVEGSEQLHAGNTIARDTRDSARSLFIVTPSGRARWRTR